jgi:hypothetical protein
MSYNEQKTDSLIAEFNDILDGKIRFFDKFNIKSVQLLSTYNPEITNENIPIKVDLPKEHKSLIYIVRRAMGLHEAGTDKKDIFDCLYVTPKISEYNKFLNIDFNSKYNAPIPINISKQYIARFVKDYIIPRAWYSQKSTDKISAAKASRVIILGSTGSGKTTFLNYTFSTHHNLLDKHDVIWVRIDLMKNINALNKLAIAKKAQLAYIIKNFYKSILKEFYTNNISRYQCCLTDFPTVKSAVKQYVVVKEA